MLSARLIVFISFGGRKDAKSKLQLDLLAFRLKIQRRASSLERRAIHYVK